MDLKQHLIRQMVFSRATFGPGARQMGVIDHIRKELAEVEESNGSAAEWVDVVILALDGLTRELWANGIRIQPGLGQLSGHYVDKASEVAAMACGLIELKQSHNEVRDWPDWRTAPADKAIEHMRDQTWTEKPTPPPTVSVKDGEILHKLRNVK
jgi:hypothetical protein